jgi:hypothetical protein
MYQLQQGYESSNRFAPVLFLFYICKKLISLVMENIKTLAVGTLGTGAIEVANHVQIPEIDPSGSSVSLILQIIVAIATLFKMFKKPKGVS